MEKFKIFLAIAIAAIATVAAGFYSYNATQENLLAQVELAAREANIEALTDGENGYPETKIPQPCHPSAYCKGTKEYDELGYKQGLAFPRDYKFLLKCADNTTRDAYGNTYPVCGCYGAISQPTYYTSYYRCLVLN